MPRSIWKGSIAFGLVQIPVALYGAEQPNELSFDMLDRRNLAPVGYERVNKRTGKKVEWKDVVKGYEYRPGKYVVVTDADLEEANVEATHTIDIEHFVDLSSISAQYFEKPYYLAATKQANKAYALLRETLRKAGKVAVCKVVIRTRQHLALIMPWQDALLLMLLRFEHELRAPDDLDLPAHDLKKLGISPKERQMAETLVESMSGEWTPAEYKDSYRDDLLHLIREKAKRGEINVVPEKSEKKAAPRPSAQLIDLAALLEESVKAGRAPSRKGQPGSKSNRSSRAKGGPRKAQPRPAHGSRKSA